MPAAVSTSVAVTALAYSAGRLSRNPSAYGIREEMAAGWLGQMAAPFRRRRVPGVVEPSSTVDSLG
jgi:hypothetical protein